MGEAAIREFLERDSERVVATLTVVCGDRQRAEDAVQEVLLDVWVKRRQIDDLCGWVTRAALNRLRSRFRSLAAEARAFDRWTARAVTSGAGHDGQLDGRLVAALGQLPRAQREAVALHYLLDLSVAQVAERLGVSEGTVKTNLHRGRRRLRAVVENSVDDEVEHV